VYTRSTPSLPPISFKANQGDFNNCYRILIFPSNRQQILLALFGLPKLYLTYNITVVNRAQDHLLSIGMLVWNLNISKHLT